MCAESDVTELLPGFACHDGAGRNRMSNASFDARERQNYDKRAILSWAIFEALTRSFQFNYSIATINNINLSSV
jgi:hypothetical protein